MSASSETGRRAFLIQAAAVAASGQPGPKPVRVGVVGVGGRGTFLAGAIVKLAQEGTPVEIAAVCDIYQPRLERAEARFKARASTVPPTCCARSRWTRW